MHQHETILRESGTIIVKIGTTLLADTQRGIHAPRILDIARGVSFLRSAGHRVAIVSSGAIGAGVAALKLTQRPGTLPEKQASAAIGQPILMEAYAAAFRQQGRRVAQVLLTRDDFQNRTRYVNAKRTLTTLLARGVVPIINENDTVAVDEIRLGDNDNLSALVACLLEADLLIILSDVDGLFTDDPSRVQAAELIPVVESISPAIEKLAKRSRSGLSTGGMITKIEAATRCAAAGIGMIITNGGNPRALQDVASGSFRGTMFLPADTRLNLRKKWIGFVSHPRGSVLVDDGATTALLGKKKSLLPSGVLEVSGDFRAHETIAVKDTAGKEIARGVSNFSSTELRTIKGRKSAELAAILGRASRAEVIHKDNLVLITG